MNQTSEESIASPHDERAPTVAQPGPDEGGLEAPPGSLDLLYETDRLSRQHTEMASKLRVQKDKVQRGIHQQQAEYDARALDAKRRIAEEDRIITEALARRKTAEDDITEANAGLRDLSGLCKRHDFDDEHRKLNYRYDAKGEKYDLKPRGRKPEGGRRKFLKLDDEALDQTPP